MAKFHDALIHLGTAVELPDDIKASLVSAYDEDITEYRNGAEAKIEQLNADLLTKDSSYNELDTKYKNDTTALKAANFDLLRAAPTRSANSNSSVADDDSDGADVDIDDLFATSN